jgi:glycosyltransferase involved in cell wall biosynthesis
MVVENVAAEIGDLRVVRGPRVVPGLRYMPAAIRRVFERRWLERLERKAKVSIDVVWLFENSRFYELSFAGSRLKIYHQVDIDQNFHVGEAARSADVCFAVSDVIVERIAKCDATAFKIPHGLMTFESVGRSALPTFLRIGRTAAGYVGNLDSAYLDFDLLEELIARSPDVDFHMIGGYLPGGRFDSRFRGKSNVICWGHLPSRDLPAALAAMDVLLLIYDTETYRAERANPHKMMEYLASGKVTVATYTEEYRTLAGELVVMAENRRDFLQKFRAVIAELGRWNAVDASEKRIAHASENTYERQLARISEALARSVSIRQRLGEIRF